MWLDQCTMQAILFDHQSEVELSKIGCGLIKTNSRGSRCYEMCGTRPRFLKTDIQSKALDTNCSKFRPLHQSDICLLNELCLLTGRKSMPHLLHTFWLYLHTFWLVGSPPGIWFVVHTRSKSLGIVHSIKSWCFFEGTLHIVVAQVQPRTPKPSSRKKVLPAESTL